jgi:hypothetical protein
MRQTDFKISIQTQFSLVVVFQLLWIFLIFTSNASVIHSNNSGPFYHLLSSLFSSNPILESILVFFIQLIIGVALNEIYKYYRIIPRRSLLILIIWSGLIVLFPSIWVLSPQLISVPLFLLVFFLLFQLSDYEPQIRDLINLSFLVSFISLIYLPFNWLLLFLLAGIAILRNFNFRFLFVILISYVVPYIYLWVYYLFTDNLAQFKSILLSLVNFRFEAPQHIFDSAILFPMLFISILLLVSLYFVAININSQLIQTRRIGLLSILFLIFVIFIGSIYLYDYKYDLILILMPLSVLLSVAILDLKSKKVFYVLLLSFMVVSLITKFLWH